MKKALSVFLVLLICFSTYISASAETVSLNSHSITVFKGKKATLKIDGVNSSQVTWKSSNKKIATVTKKGVVTAKAPGTATVTGKYKKITFRCKVTVQNVKKLNTLLYSGEYGKLWLKEINSNGFVIQFKNTTKKDLWLDSEYFILDGEQLEDDGDTLPGTDMWVYYNDLVLIVPAGFTRKGTMYLRNPSTNAKKLSGYIMVMERHSDGGGYNIGRILLKNVKLQ